MAEFTEVMKHKARMCEDGVCFKCGLSSYQNGHDLNCPDFIKKLPKEAEEIIMKWAEENPMITNRDKLEEVFGHLIDANRFKGCHGICFYPNDTDCSICKHRSFWEQEYKEPKGE